MLALLETDEDVFISAEFAEDKSKEGSNSVRQCPGMGPWLTHQGTGTPGPILCSSALLPLI